MSNDIDRRGLMLVLSSPSGAGKTTLSRRLLDEDDGISLSVSVTTRTKRTSEVHGKDYYFFSKDEFHKMVADDEFLEHATVFDNFYGTARKPVIEELERGGDVLFDIDWQGTQQLKLKMRDDLVSVFILPPSHKELERRLRTRAEDSDEVVAARMAKAFDEISHWPEYDYIIVNHDVEEALAELKAILSAERRKSARQVGLPGFITRLI
jgi:guanylate kinase